MAATITCRYCGAAIKSTKDIPAGKKIKCPNCEQSFVVADKTEQEKKAPANDNPFASIGSGNSDKVDLPPPPRSNPLPLILFVCGTLFLVSCCCGVGVVSWGFQESFKRLLRLKQADDGPGKGGSGPRTPHAFADEITRDASASQKYAGKSLVIEGEVGRVERVGKEQKLGLVLFANPPHALEFAMKPSDQAKAVRLALGQRVKVTAIFRGTRDNRFLMFDTAGVTESEPAKVLEISSQKLVESLVNGGPEEADRFRGVVLISGPIVEFKDAAPGETVVKMRGSGKVSLCLVFDRDGAKEAARLEKAKGATIRIVDGVDFDRVEQRVVVHRPLVVEAK